MSGTDKDFFRTTSLAHVGSVTERPSGCDLKSANGLFLPMNRPSNRLSLGKNRSGDLFYYHWVPQFSNSRDLHHYFVAGLQETRWLACEAYSRGRSGGDHVAWLQRYYARYVSH